MLKKMKRVPMDSSPSYMVDEEARARFKHQSLIQDYEDLLKETEAAKNRLLVAKQKRLTLLAEVRFLRRRYKFLIKNQSRGTQRQPEVDPARLQISEIRRETLTKERSYREKEASFQDPSPALDLNQIARDNEGEFQVLEPVRMEKKPKSCLGPLGGDEQLNDLKLSVCRGTGNGSNRAGKRKISWQDQVVLRV